MFQTFVPAACTGRCEGTAPPREQVVRLGSCSPQEGAPPLRPRVTFPSRGKSPKARQGLRPLESPWVSAKLWEPDEVRFEGWNAKPIELKAITIPYRPFRARCASRRATFCHRKRPICHFEVVGESVLFFSLVLRRKDFVLLIRGAGGWVARLGATLGLNGV